LLAIVVWNWQSLNDGFESALAGAGTLRRSGANSHFGRNVRSWIDGLFSLDLSRFAESALSRVSSSETLPRTLTSAGSFTAARDHSAPRYINPNITCRTLRKFAETDKPCA
jgi:hypothetical protein